MSGGGYSWNTRGIEIERGTRQSTEVVKRLGEFLLEDIPMIVEKEKVVDERS